MSNINKLFFKHEYNSYGEALGAYLDDKFGRGGRKILAKRLIDDINDEKKLQSKQSEIGRWINGATPIERTQEEINELLNICINLNNEGKWQISRTETGPGYPSKQERFDNGNPSDAVIPYYKEVKPGAGNGRIITPDDESDMVQIKLPRAYITHELQANPSDLVIMRVWSDSMEPEIDDGDVIFVSRSVAPPFEGKIYIIRMNDSYLCKYLQELPGDRIRVFSENARYKAFEIQMGNESQEDFEIFGRVIFNGQKR